MGRLSRQMVASALAATALTLASPALAQQVVGNASSVVGEVRMSNAAQAEPRRVQLRQRIAWGDLIQTGGGSQAQILLLDRTTFGIGARTRVRIDSYVYDPDAERSLAASLLRGALRFLSGRQASSNSAEVTSPSGRIGIRGTAIDMLVGEDARNIARDEPAVGGGNNARDSEATLVVLRGPGAGTAGGLTPGLADVTAAGVTVRLDRPGHAAFIPRLGAPPIGPFMISDAGLARVQQELAGEVSRAADGGLLGDILPVAGALAAVAVGVLVATDGGDNGQTADNPNGQPTSTLPNPNSDTAPPPTSVPGGPNVN